MSVLRSNIHYKIWAVMQSVGLYRGCLERLLTDSPRRGSGGTYWTRALNTVNTVYVSVRWFLWMDTVRVRVPIYNYVCLCSCLFKPPSSDYLFLCYHSSKTELFYWLMASETRPGEHGGGGEAARTRWGGVPKKGERDGERKCMERVKKRRSVLSLRGE